MKNFIFMLLISIAVAVASSEADIGETKLEEMERLERESLIPNIINMTDAQQYIRLVAAVNEPRPYHVVLFFTLVAEGRDAKCPACGPAEDQLHQAAYSYS